MCSIEQICKHPRLPLTISFFLFTTIFYATDAIRLPCTFSPTIVVCHLYRSQPRANFLLLLSYCWLAFGKVSTTVQSSIQSFLTTTAAFTCDMGETWLYGGLSIWPEIPIIEYFWPSPTMRGSSDLIMFNFLDSSLHCLNQYSVERRSCCWPCHHALGSNKFTNYLGDQDIDLTALIFHVSLLCGAIISLSLVFTLAQGFWTLV